MQNLNIDFQLLEECKAQIGKEQEYKNEKIENIECIDENELKDEERKRYEQIGSEIISNGKYAAVTMAGGQRNKIRVQCPKRYIFSKCKTTAQIHI